MGGYVGDAGYSNGIAITVNPSSRKDTVIKSSSGLGHLGSDWKTMAAINILFDGPPNVAGRLVEFITIEDDEGRNVDEIGEWIGRENGLWALRIVELPGELPPPKFQGKPAGGVPPTSLKKTLSIAITDKKCYIEGVECIAETDKALLCRAAESGDQWWIPRSQIDEDSEVYDEGHVGLLVISEWIATQKGIVDDADIE